MRLSAIERRGSFLVPELSSAYGYTKFGGINEPREAPEGSPGLFSFARTLCYACA